LRIAQHVPTASPGLNRANPPALGIALDDGARGAWLRSAKPPTLGIAHNRTAAGTGLLGAQLTALRITICPGSARIQILCGRRRDRRAQRCYRAKGSEEAFRHVVSSFGDATRGAPDHWAVKPKL
jgi:hypothetical protein